VNEAVKVFTRRGNDWTKRFRKVADDAWHIGVGSAIIDGEIVVPAADGTTDFSVLQNELRGDAAAAGAYPDRRPAMNRRDHRDIAIGLVVAVLCTIGFILLFLSN